MGFTLYNAPQSTCSQRVRFVLNAKGLPFDEVKLNLLAGDQLKPDYLKLNPNGVVPTLDDDGRIVIDSNVITEYLDEVAPRDELHAGGPGRARPHARADAFHRRDAGRRRARADLQPRLPAELPEDEPRGLHCLGRESKPLRREFMLTMGQTGFPPAEMDAALGRLRRILRAHGRRDREERRAVAARQGHLARRRGGDAGAGAHARSRLADWQDLRRIVTWFDNIRAQPAFKPTFYPGSLLSERFPHLREKQAESA